MATVSELVTKFSFVGSLKPQTKFNKGLMTSIKSLTGFALASKITNSALLLWANSVFRSVDSMANLQAQTKANIQSLQELGYVASQNSSSIESFSNSITVMTRRVGRYAQFGGGAAKNAIERIGLQVKDSAGNVRDSVDIFMDIADKLRGMSEGEKLAIIQDFGMSADMLQTLSLTREELQGLRKEARDMGVFSQEDADAVVAYGGAITKLKYTLTSLQTTVAIGLAPVLTEMAQSFSALIARNKEWIVAGLERLGKILLSVSQAIGRLMPIFTAMVGVFIALKVTTLGFAGALSVLLSPAILIGLAIGSALLIIDDLIVAMEGGESVIANFFQSFLGVDIVPFLNETVTFAKYALGEIWAFMTGFTSIVGDLFRGVWALLSGDFEGALTHFNSAAETVYGLIARGADNLWKGVKYVFEDMLGFDLSPIEDTFEEVIDFVTDLFSDGFKGAIDKVVDMVMGLGATVKKALTDIIPDWLKESLNYLGIASFELTREDGDTPPRSSYIGAGAAQAVSMVSKPSEQEDVYLGGGVGQAISQTTQTTTQNVNNNQDINIVVNGRDADVVADKVVAGIGGASSMLLAKRGGM